jgi:hypothetical protein
MSHWKNSQKLKADNTVTTSTAPHWVKQVTMSEGGHENTFVHDKLHTIHPIMAVSANII